MPLRIHFDGEDLLRTRWVASPAPLLELGLALATLRSPGRGAGWRRRTLQRLPAQARPLFDLVPASGAGPVFLDPVSAGLDDGLEAVWDTPTDTVHDELRRVLATAPTVPSWVRDLDRRDRRAWSGLASALRAAHATVLDPLAERRAQLHRTELEVRGAVVAEHGLRAGLRGIAPGAAWQGSVLHLPSRHDRDLVLGGRGLTLHPSAFWTGPPLFCDHPDGSVLLVHPGVGHLPSVSAPEGDDPLPALLGATRAAILAGCRTPHTTTELAREFGVGASTISEHTGVLRAAGLLVTVRAGRSVLHTCTDLGTALLVGPR